jgi:hypothetical protein
MEQTHKNDLVPEQKSGAKTDIEATQTFSSVEEASEFYKLCRQRLLNINEWGNLAGVASADFILTDSSGNELTRNEANVGDHFKINIPGPGTVSGEGYDWVQIENIEANSSNADESVAIQVRPASSPTNANSDVAHFFTDDATSTFVVERRGTTVYAGVHGRNEKRNTKAEAVVDKTRNAMVALGAVAGFSDVQWKSLVNGILGK